MLRSDPYMCKDNKVTTLKPFPKEPYWHALFYYPLFFWSIHNLNEIVFVKARQ